jgi:uncharacterized ubiquitin-like protein YukD
MSKRQFVTIKFPNSNQEVDLEVPADEPIRTLMPDLLKALQWSVTPAGKKVSVKITAETGNVVDANQSLQEAGIENFDVLTLSNVVMDEGAASQLADSPSGEHKLSYTHSTETRIPIEAPCMLSEQGMMFVLGKRSVLIGRRSKDIIPGIDLTDLDPQMTSSRKHALIAAEDQDYFLQALETKNGTFINGVEIQAGQKQRLKNKDVILFGFRGVQLTFKIPSK